MRETKSRAPVVPRSKPTITFLANKRTYHTQGNLTTTSPIISDRDRTLCIDILDMLQVQVQLLQFHKSTHTDEYLWLHDVSSFQVPRDCLHRPFGAFRSCRSLSFVFWALVPRTPCNGRGTDEGFLTAAAYTRARIRKSRILRKWNKHRLCTMLLRI